MNIILHMVLVRIHLWKIIHFYFYVDFDFSNCQSWRFKYAKGHFTWYWNRKKDQIEIQSDIFFDFSIKWNVLSHIWNVKIDSCWNQNRHRNRNGLSFNDEFAQIPSINIFVVYNLKWALGHHQLNIFKITKYFEIFERLFLGLIAILFLCFMLKDRIKQ